MAKVRVLLADDHVVIREGLKALLEAQPHLEVVGETAGGGETVAAAQALDPDVVVINVWMPGLGTVRATEVIRRECPGSRVIVLTAHEDPDYLRILLQAGASAYISSRGGSQDLVNAILGVAAHRSYIDQPLAAEILGNPVIKDPDLDRERDEALSDRETEVVQLLARGLTYQEIGAQLGLGRKTVDTYRGRSMKKLGLSSRAELVSYALRRGWLYG